MGRQKNLEALGARRDYLKNKVAGMPDTDVTKDVFEDELDALVWALRKLEAEEIGVGDRVKLKVYDDEEGHQPKQGEVLGHVSGGYLIRPFTGPDSGTNVGLWYGKDSVWLVDP